MTTLNIKMLAARNEGLVAQVRARIGFEKYELLLSEAGPAELALIENLPVVGALCRVMTHGNNRSGSAFTGMSEEALVCGYMMASDDAVVKVLVAFHERADADSDLCDFGLYSHKQIKISKVLLNAHLISA